MREDGARSGQHSDEPGGGGGASGPHRGFASDVRRVWRDFKELVTKILRVGDMIGNVALEAHRVVLGGARLLARYGRVAMPGAVVGLTAPATGGWGIEALSGSPWAWAPVAGLPAALVGLRGVVALLRATDREGDRQQSRQKKEQKQPDLHHRLQREAGRRKAINGRFRGNGDTPPLESHDYVLDVMAEAVYQVGVRGCRDVALTLRRWSRKRGLREAATRGVIDDIVNGRLEEVSWDEMVDFDRALGEALDPLEYAHAAVAFTAGAHHYLLVGISGAPIPDHARLEISHAATRLVERYAQGDEEIDAGRIRL